MSEIVLNLTKREIEAVLRSRGFTNGNGVIRSQALQSAEMKIIGALSRAQGGEPRENR